MHFDCFANVEVNGKDYKLAVEFHGPQHYSFNPRFHKSLKDFYSSKQRDKMKIALCEKENITYIDVPYSVKNRNFQKFIIKEFEAKTGEKFIGVEDYDYHEIYRQSDGAQKTIEDFIKASKK